MRISLVAIIMETGKIVWTLLKSSEIKLMRISIRVMMVVMTGKDK